LVVVLRHKLFDGFIRGLILFLLGLLYHVEFSSSDDKAEGLYLFLLLTRLFFLLKSAIGDLLFHVAGIHQQRLEFFKFAQTLISLALLDVHKHSDLRVFVRQLLDLPDLDDHIIFIEVGRDFDVFG